MIRDRQGTVIAPGVHVAYNLSGQVALGTVERLTHGVREPVFIAPDEPWCRITRLSQVKNRISIVVIGNSERP